MPSPVEARSGSEVHNEQTCRLPWLRASVTSKWLRKGSWFAWLTVSLDTSHQKANLSRRKEHRSWARQAGLSCGKERHAGSQAPLPRLLSFRASHKHGMKDPHLFSIHTRNRVIGKVRESRWTSLSSKTVAPALLPRFSLVQLWSFGKRSCHAIGDEHKFCMATSGRQ